MMQAKDHLIFWGRSWRPIEAQASRRSRIYFLQGGINVNWFTQLQAKKRYPGQVIGQATRIIERF
jgi:hypothetical protein